MYDEIDYAKHLVDLDTEKAVLSSYLWDNDTFVTDGANRSNFTGSNVTVYDSIAKLINAQITADIVSVAQECFSLGVKMSYVSEISDYPLTSNVGYSVSKLRDFTLKRSAVAAWSKGRTSMLGAVADPLEVIQATNAAIEFPESCDTEAIGDAIGDFFNRFIAAKKAGESTKIMSGIGPLDYVVGGFDKAEVVIVGGRPGHGKTSAAMNWVKRWGDYGIPGLACSLEMSKDQLSGRMACDVGSIDGKYIMRDELEYDNPDHKQIWSDFRSAIRQISAMPILINDDSGQTIHDIRATARREKYKNDIRWVMIDYVQLIKGWDKDGQGCKSEIMSEIKAMSKELDVTVVVVSQMNREIEKRAMKIPKNSDLRDAGAIEQVADHIVFCVIPSKFPDAPDADLADKGKAWLFVSKTRRGEVGAIGGIRWEGKYFRYYASGGY